MTPLDDDPLNDDGPWVVYLAHCIRCGRTIAHVAHVDDVARGEWVGNILCTSCSVMPPSLSRPASQA